MNEGFIHEFHCVHAQLTTLTAALPPISFLLGISYCQHAAEFEEEITLCIHLLYAELYPFRILCSMPPMSGSNSAPAPSYRLLRIFYRIIRKKRCLPNIDTITPNNVTMRLYWCQKDAINEEYARRASGPNDDPASNIWRRASLCTKSFSQSRTLATNTLLECHENKRGKVSKTLVPRLRTLKTRMMKAAGEVKSTNILLDCHVNKLNKKGNSLGDLRHLIIFIWVLSCMYHSN